MLPINDDGDLGNFELYKVRSVYHSTSLERYYHIHPEAVVLIHHIEHTILCYNCSVWHRQTSTHAKPPENSIASGIDFGDARRINLEPTTLMEQTVLSRYRLYHNIVKIHNNVPTKIGDRIDGTKCQIRASCILFPTNSSNVVAMSLLSKIMKCEENWNEVSDHLKELLTFQLVGTEAEMDTLLKNMGMSSLMKCRPYVLFQRLAIYQHLHSQYEHDPSLPDASSTDFESFFDALKSQIQHFNSLARSSVTKVTDETSINADKYDCDDIAQVRTHVVTHAVLPTDIPHPSSCERDVELSYSLLTKNPIMDVTGEEYTDVTCRKAMLDAVAEAFGVTLPNNEHNPEAWMVTKDEVPENEFTAMDKLLPGTFPEIFLLGKAYEKSCLPSKSQIRHLLLQFTNAAATHRQLMFYLFDTQARHDVIYNYNTKIRKDPTAWQKFSKLMTSEEFLQKVSVAAADPKQDPKITREVIKTVLPVMSFGTKRSVAGSLTDSSGMSRAYALHRRYGHGTAFYTLTPDDQNNPNFIRLSKPLNDNVSFLLEWMLVF